MKLPPDHPQRIELNDEVHARPPEPLTTPSRASYLALLCGPPHEEDTAPVADLCRRYGLAPPVAGVSHFSATFPDFRLKWERHTEFIRWMFIADGMGEDLFGDPALRAT